MMRIVLLSLLMLLTLTNCGNRTKKDHTGAIDFEISEYIDAYTKIKVITILALHSKPTHVSEYDKELNAILVKKVDAYCRNRGGVQVFDKREAGVITVVSHGPAPKYPYKTGYRASVTCNEMHD